MTSSKRKVARRLLKIAAVLLLVVIAGLAVFANFFLEPLLRKKLHSLIVQGSDSLYVYELGNLKASFLGGNLRVEDLKVRLEPGHYEKLRFQHALPSLTVEMNMKRGEIRGIGFLALLMGRKVVIEEIYSRDADIRLIRQIPDTQKVVVKPPLWKAIQPAIAAINIRKVNLDGIKFLYKPRDTAQSFKLQFDRFDAQLRDIRIDSTAALDTNRIGFASNLLLRLHDMKYRTADSSYKLKAEWITFSSTDRSLVIDSFRMQPTLDKKDFYRYYGLQASLYDLSFVKVRLARFSLDRFINNNVLEADSMVLEVPKLLVYLDKTQEKQFKSKIGSYPHQKLMGAVARVHIGHLAMRDAAITYTEKNGKTGEEGTLQLSDVDLAVQNATNDPEWIARNPLCTAAATGRILNGSPLAIRFRFYLDSTNGRFDTEGSIENVSAAQLSSISVPLANTEIPSLQIHRLAFSIKAADYEATANVQMRYNNLSVLMRKTDETGRTTERGFLNTLLNRFAMYPHNPMPGAAERHATGVRHLRLTTQSFFGVIWKSIFTGMQQLMLKGQE
jgi:hypothetical protein